MRGPAGSIAMNLDELWEWLGFISKLILECVCIAAWIVMTWWLHGYLAQTFPLHGIPELMLDALEIIFYLATLYHLIKLLFLPRKKHQNPNWWR